jgi:dipeptidyl aminopeptidase/acylaminoacyl peptidase
VPAANFRLSNPQVWQTEKPLPARAVRREITYTVAGRPNQKTFFYTPDDGQTTSLPTLLAVYPGPADQWETVSLPLAQAGFALIAVGPEYALDLEADVDDLHRLVSFAKNGTLPRADGTRIGALGGSYSSLHVLRLAVREPETLDAALLLGPPTDMFELRRAYEAGSFFPPFGLDQALIALGLPSNEPERYWRYSSRYHARSLDLPLMLIHSKADEVVPFTQSQLLADELERLGKPHELSIIEGMGHYLLATERTPAIDDLFNTTTDFFDRTLQQ